MSKKAGRPPKYTEDKPKSAEVKTVMIEMPIEMANKLDELAERLTNESPIQEKVTRSHLIRQACLKMLKEHGMI